MVFLSGFDASFSSEKATKRFEFLAAAAADDVPLPSFRQRFVQWPTVRSFGRFAARRFEFRRFSVPFFAPRLATWPVYDGSSFGRRLRRRDAEFFFGRCVFFLLLRPDVGLFRWPDPHRCRLTVADFKLGAIGRHRNKKNAKKTQKKNEDALEPCIPPFI